MSLSDPRASSSYALLRNLSSSSRLTTAGHTSPHLTAAIGIRNKNLVVATRYVLLQGAESMEANNRINAVGSKNVFRRVWVHLLVSAFIVLAVASCSQA